MIERGGDGNRLAVPETGRPVATRDRAEEKQQADVASQGKVAGINDISLIVDCIVIKLLLWFDWWDSSDQ